MHAVTAPLTPYRDRSEGGRALARLLLAHAGHQTLVLALPRGGIPVAQEVARSLNAPLDVFVVRKLGLPGQPEFAMGAIATGGAQLIDETLIRNENVPEAVVADVIARETVELQRRELRYRNGRATPAVAGRHVILIDDGVATGYTMRVAVLALRRLKPARLTLAFPVGAPETCKLLAAVADDVVCPLQPSPLLAVGLWYEHFPQLTDADVRDGLEQSLQRRGRTAFPR